ncbi:MAG: energy transducer TonB, partial [Terracidiphilus sp.]
RPLPHCTVILNVVKNLRLPLRVLNRHYFRVVHNTPRTTPSRSSNALRCRLVAMKTTVIVLLLALAPVLAVAQPEPSNRLDQVTSKEFLQQLIQDDVYLFVSRKSAESLLTRRIQPVLPSSDSIGAKVSGTVIIAFEITKEGKVRHAMAVSGPKLLQKPVLDAVRQWVFKPFLLINVPTTVATSIPLTVSN